MSIFNHTRKFTAICCLLLIGTMVYAGDPLQITVTNDGTDDVLVTVRDMNTHAHGKVLDGQRISGFASVPVSAAAGAAGTAHLSWTAVTTDPDVHRCGHGDKSALANFDSVHVVAQSTCHTRARRKPSNP
jgi:hypothetical protein